MDEKVDYEYGQCEYAIGQEDWADGDPAGMTGAIQKCIVGTTDANGDDVDEFFIPHRRISTRTVLRQEVHVIDGIATRVFIIRIYDTVDFAYPTTQAVIVENPVLKHLAVLYQNELTPEVTVEYQGPDPFFIGSRTSYNILTKHFDPDELHRNFWIVRPDYPVQIKQGYNLIKGGRPQGRMLQVERTELVKLDSRGSALSGKRKFSMFGLSEEDGSVINEKTKPKNATGVPVDGLEVSSVGFWPDEDENSRGNVKMRSAMFINTKRSPLH